MKTFSRTTRTLATAAAGTLVCAGTALGLGLASGGAEAATSPRTVLHLVSHDIPGQTAFDDLGAPSPQGPDLGDVVAFTQRLTRHGRTVGRISNAGVGVDHQRHLFQADGTIVLPHGRIEVAGLVSMGSRFRLAVTGGTGRFTGANGWMDFANVDGRQLITVTLTR